MPLDPVVAERLTLVAGAQTWDEIDPSFGAPVGDYASPPVAVEATMADSVPVRIYRPVSRSELSPGLVWLHGGGFAAGDLDMPEADYVAREVAHRAGAVVITVDYRLAVDGVHHPAPLDDVVAAWSWVERSAAQLGMERTSLGGASAGGNLAAAAALRLRDAGARLPATLVLAYPAMHPELLAPSPSLAADLREVPGVLVFSPEEGRRITENYLGGPVSSADGYSFPALADVTGLPPTLVVNSEYDSLRSSGELFAAQLADAGVPVSSRYEPGTLHGHLNTVGLDGALRTIDSIADVVRTSALPEQPDDAA
jgi:acetyl esterase